MKHDDEKINIASVDIKGAYDGIDHGYLTKKLEEWRKQKFINNETVEFIKFLYS